ncbi:MAG TPA: phosphopantetheine-binding protein, partial [Aggregicoccus sp.]|nr:phosphopantetheine-binding protein [Aggregicoccus sp.]
GHGAAIAAHARVSVGNRVQLGAFVMVMDTDFHDAVNRDQLPEGQPILIGHAVRIGSRVTVLRGSVIGEGAQIEAGSVVSGEIPAHTVAGGVPARVLRRVGEAAHAAASAPAEPAGPRAAAAGGALERVGQVVQLTFNLPAVPAADAGPQQVKGWDSLGTLRLVLALEDAFGVSLSEDDMARVRTLADLATTVEAAARRRHAGTHAA